MKNRYLLLIFFISLISWSCSDNSELAKPQDLKSTTLDAKNILVSPKGLTIAKSLKELKSKIAPQILDQHGKKVDFTIEKISYIETEKQTVAIIDFKNVNGEISNIAFITDVKSRNPNSGDQTVLSYPSDGGGKTYTAKCTRTGSCECSVIGTASGDKVTFQCSCEQCTLVVKEV